MRTCSDLIDSADKDSMFLNRIITGDETLSFLHDPQLKRQSATWKSPSSPRRKKLQLDGSKDKVMHELFLTYLELFTQNSSQKQQMKTSIPTRSFAVYAITFVISVLSFGAG
jgi:hypothetical protein